MSKAALLVIDVQKGLFERSNPIYQAQQLLSNLNQLIEAARVAAAPVIFIQHESEKTFLKGSDAWQFHPQIRPLEAEHIVHKQHGDAFVDTNLHDELAKMEITDLVITGLVTHGCVRATCLGAIERGYRVILVSDAHSNYSKGASGIIEKWNNALSEKGAELRMTNEMNFSNMQVV